MLDHEGGDGPANHQRQGVVALPMVVPVVLQKRDQFRPARRHPRELIENNKMLPSGDMVGQHSKSFPPVSCGALWSPVLLGQLSEEVVDLSLLI